MDEKDIEYTRDLYGEILDDLRSTVFEAYMKEMQDNEPGTNHKRRAEEFKEIEERYLTLLFHGAEDFRTRIGIESKLDFLEGINAGEIEFGITVPVGDDEKRYTIRRHSSGLDEDDPDDSDDDDMGDGPDDDTFYIPMRTLN